MAQLNFINLNNTPQIRKHTLSLIKDSAQIISINCANILATEPNGISARLVDLFTLSVAQRREHEMQNR